MSDDKGEKAVKKFLTGIARLNYSIKIGSRENVDAYMQSSQNRIEHLIKTKALSLPCVFVHGEETFVLESDSAEDKKTDTVMIISDTAISEVDRNKICEKLRKGYQNMSHYVECQMPTKLLLYDNFLEQHVDQLGTTVSSAEKTLQNGGKYVGFVERNILRDYIAKFQMLTRLGLFSKDKPKQDDVKFAARLKIAYPKFWNITHMLGFFHEKGGKHLVDFAEIKKRLFLLFMTLWMIAAIVMITPVVHIPIYYGIIAMALPIVICVFIELMPSRYKAFIKQQVTEQKLTPTNAKELGVNIESNQAEQNPDLSKVFTLHVVEEQAKKCDSSSSPAHALSNMSNWMV